MDAADRAQKFTDADLADALNAHSHHPDRTRTIVRCGVHYCIDCDAEIPAERVKALHKARQPASRCVECQEMQERYREGYTR